MYDFLSSQLGKVYDFIFSQRGKVYEFISSQLAYSEDNRLAALTGFNS